LGAEKRTEWSAGKKRQCMRKNDFLKPKVLATGLLVVVTVLFALTRSFEDRWPWLGWVRAFSEAALVGALADWFAVVALFRHPLGLPIPHTAIIPRRKKEIGETLGNFVVENFLSTQTVGPWFDKLNFASYAATFLKEHGERLARHAADFIPGLLSGFNQHKVAALVFGQLRSMIERMPAAPALGEIIDYFTRDGAHEAVLNHVLSLASELVKSNRDRIQAEIAAEVPLPDLPLLGDLKQVVADYIADKTVSRICENLVEASENSEHELRRSFRFWVGAQVQRLRSSPAYLEKGEEIKRRILSDPALVEYVSHVWEGIQSALLEDVKSGDSKVQTALADFVRGIGGRLEADAELQDTFNASIKRWALELLSEHRGSIQRLIADTVDAWEAQSMVAKVEDAVGADLQFIRLNGTLVGGLVGLLLHGFQKIVWR